MVKLVRVLVQWSERRRWIQEAVQGWCQEDPGAGWGSR